MSALEKQLTFEQLCDIIETRQFNADTLPDLLETYGNAAIAKFIINNVHGIEPAEVEQIKEDVFTYVTSQNLVRDYSKVIISDGYSPVETIEDLYELNDISIPETPRVLKTKPLKTAVQTAQEHAVS